MAPGLARSWHDRPSNKPLEWTGPHLVSALPPNAPCLPLRGSVRRHNWDMEQPRRSPEHTQDFPGGSKSRVNRAGQRVREGSANAEDLQVIDEWRAAHRAVLNTFKVNLIQRGRGKGIIFAQRHKRKRTIFNKLARFPSMNLSRMDDVAGCRLIFQSINELYSFRDQFHKARFKHKRRNADDKDKYDYIKNPKESGYGDFQERCHSLAAFQAA